MKAEAARTLRAFLLELGVYAVLVSCYFFFVLHYLSGWLQELHLNQVKLYAIIVIAMIVGQAVGLGLVSGG
jgi:hypothetical protein